jgi:hypothetical protein
MLVFFSNPVVGIIGWLATILGLVLTVYFYIEAKETRQLTYYLNPVKAALVRSGQASRLSTTFDNKPIKGDITAAQVALWNQGKLAIKKQDMLKPVVLYTENNAPILEATIRKSSRDVTGLSLATEQLQQGRVGISWDILERNDGCVIQLIYAGNPDLNLSIDGVIEGQPQLEQAKFSGRIRSPEEQFTSAKRGNRFVGFSFATMGMVMIAGGIFLEVSLRRHLRKVEKSTGWPASRLIRKILPFVAMLFGGVYVVLGVAALFKSQELGPPFGF